MSESSNILPAGWVDVSKWNSGETYGAPSSADLFFRLDVASVDEEGVPFVRVSLEKASTTTIEKRDRFNRIGLSGRILGSSESCLPESYADLQSGLIIPNSFVMIETPSNQIEALPPLTQVARLATRASQS